MIIEALKWQYRPTWYLLDLSNLFAYETHWLISLQNSSYEDIFKISVMFAE